jgi:hypothetical protein
MGSVKGRRKVRKREGIGVVSERGSEGWGYKEGM